MLAKDQLKKDWIKRGELACLTISEYGKNFMTIWTIKREVDLISGFTCLSVLEPLILARLSSA